MVFTNSPKSTKYGTINLTFFLPPFLACSVICCLYLNEILLLFLAGKSIILLLLSRAALSLKYCHRLTDVF